jgi:hypothetical protein
MTVLRGYTEGIMKVLSGYTLFIIRVLFECIELKCSCFVCNIRVLSVYDWLLNKHSSMWNQLAGLVFRAEENRR